MQRRSHPSGICAVHDLQPTAFDADFANRVVSATRPAFGGHVEEHAPVAGR